MTNIHTKRMVLIFWSWLAFFLVAPVEAEAGPAAKSGDHCCIKGELYPYSASVCKQKSGLSFSDAESAKAKCVPASGWCVYKGKLQRSTEKKCKQRKLKYFAKEKDARQYLTTLNKPKSPPGKPAIKKSLAKPDAAIKKTGQMPAVQQKGFLKPSAQVQAPDTTVKSPANAAAGQALQLPIIFHEPVSGLILRPWSEVPIRYSINAPTDPGDVTFRLLSASGAEMAVLTWPFHARPFNLEDVELERAGPGNPPGEAPEPGTPLLPVYESEEFNWWLADVEDLPDGSGYYIRAHKGGLQGRSRDFEIRTTSLIPDSSRTVTVAHPAAGYTTSDNYIDIIWDASHPNAAFRVSFLKGEEVVASRTQIFTLGLTTSFLSSSFLSGSDYYARVEMLDADGISSGVEAVTSSDTSGPFNFFNNSMTLTEFNPLSLVQPSSATPAGDDHYVIGEEMEIRWRHWPSDARSKRYDLTLVRETAAGGGSWPIESNVRGGNNDYGNFTWTIPNTIPSGEGYRVQVQETDSSASTNSRYPFIIDPP